MEKEEKDSAEIVETKRDLFAVTQKAIFYNEDGKFLILKDSGNDGASSVKVLGEWQLPGGHVDHKDADTVTALKREIKEEMGGDVICDIKDTILSMRYDYGSFERIANFILIRYESGEIVLSDEHDELKWVTLEEVRDGDEYKEWLVTVLDKAKAKIEEIEAHEKMLRTLADFDNYKKRSVEERAEFAKYASEKVIMEMLPVLDNFHAATGFVPEEQKDSPWLTGIMFIQQQMEKVFEDAGVKSIEISTGDAFDATLMESVAESTEMAQNGAEGEDDGAAPAEASASQGQKVVKIVQKGYMIGDRLLRPARVEVT